MDRFSESRRLNRMYPHQRRSKSVIADNVDPALLVIAEEDEALTPGQEPAPPSVLRDGFREGHGQPKCFVAAAVATAPSTNHAPAKINFNAIARLRLWLASVLKRATSLFAAESRL